MKRRNRVARFFKFLYLKLWRINDTPQKIAQGFGLGVFLGILPGVGFIAALVMASVLRMNRVSAFLGTLLTNTWLSFVTFLLSIKVGSAIMGLAWQRVHTDVRLLLKDFHWQSLLTASARDVIAPIAVGYCVVSAALGLIAYALMLIIISRIHNAKNKGRAHLSR